MGRDSLTSRTLGGLLASSRCQQRVWERHLAPPARLKLSLLDPQVAREVGIVAAHLLDEALGVLAADNVSTASPSG